MNSKQSLVLKKYLTKGIIKGVEFLLVPEIALEFLNDLAYAVVQVDGCDLWRFLDSEKDPNRIVSLLGDGIIVDDTIHIQENIAYRNADIIKNYIENHLPDDAELISFIYNDSEIYDFYKNSKG